jgi:hypothetical protein
MGSSGVPSGAVDRRSGAARVSSFHVEAFVMPFRGFLLIAWGIGYRAWTGIPVIATAAIAAAAVGGVPALRWLDRKRGRREPTVSGPERGDQWRIWFDQRQSGSFDVRLVDK